jgi:hypothetical protein
MTACAEQERRDPGDARMVAGLFRMFTARSLARRSKRRGAEKKTFSPPGPRSDRPLREPSVTATCHDQDCPGEATDLPGKPLTRSTRA